MRRMLALGLGAVVVISAAALAGDPPKKDAAPVEVRLAVKAGDVFRFRQTDASFAEVDGNPYRGDETTREYTVTVKTANPGSGVVVAVAFELVRARLLDRATGEWMEFDSSKAAPAEAAMKVQMLDAVARALVGRPFSVTLDAHGSPTAVTGLREAATEGVKGSGFEEMLPMDQIFADKDCMKLAALLFTGAPAEPRAIGAKWSGDMKDDVSSQTLDFSAEWTLASATTDDATVSAKLTWKPGAAATAGGAKAVGGGEATTRFSRKDGFVLSAKKHVEAKRDTGAMKAASHTDSTIERLLAKAAGGATGADPAKSPPPKEPDPAKK